MIRCLLSVIILWGSIGLAESKEIKNETLAKIAANYDCYYGQSAEPELTWQSVIRRPGCSAGNLCVANIFCRKKNDSTLEFSPEIRTQIVCNTSKDFCPAKASDCLADPDVDVTGYSGRMGGAPQQPKTGAK